MNLKKLFIIIGVVGVAGAIFWNGCSHRPCFCKDDFPDRVLKRMDKKIAKLDLKEDQQEVYDKIRADIRVDLLKFRDEKMSAFNKVNAEIKLENPNMDKIADIAKKSHGRHPEKFKVYVDRFVELYNVLDQEQKAIVIEKFRDMAEYFECD